MALGAPQPIGGSLDFFLAAAYRRAPVRVGRVVNEEAAMCRKARAKVEMGQMERDGASEQTAAGRTLSSHAIGDAAGGVVG
ncbi:MAG: hypothetical protein ACRDQU_15180 [Pseudonocardiaceae bacterium]